jgi:hypothetical protein
MKKAIFKILVINILLFLILYASFYLVSFLSGYGSNGTYIKDEIRLFIAFFILQTIIILFYLYKAESFTVINVAVIFFETVVIYLFVASWLQYF